MTGDHIDETAKAITQLVAQHEDSATPPEKLIERLMGHIGGPAFILGLAFVIGAWCLVNGLAPRLGFIASDPPPFLALQTMVSLLALFFTLIILNTQRRAGLLSRHRSNQTLRLAMLAEQKSAKTIELLEEIRRDNPLLKNRLDTEAHAMAKPADPAELLRSLEAPDGAELE